MIKYDFMDVIPSGFFSRNRPRLITQCIHLGSTFEQTIQDGANSEIESHILVTCSKDSSFYIPTGRGGAT